VSGNGPVVGWIKRSDRARDACAANIFFLFFSELQLFILWGKKSIPRPSSMDAV
jgi:hypothetical protein